MYNKYPFFLFIASTRILESKKIKPFILQLYCASLLFLLLSSTCVGQGIAIGDWQIHLPFSDAKQVVEAGDRIYCATGSSVFYLDKGDNSLTRMSKVSGLSDVQVSTIGYEAYGDILIIAYTNANIDLVKQGVVNNISDIKRKSILGDKSLNSIAVYDGFAYIACGFGIVALDLQKNEIKDTYYISTAQDAVNQIVVHADTIYAATDNGLYKAPFSNANLTDFNTWVLEAKLTATTYSSIAVLNGELFIVQSNNPGDTILNDSVFVRDVNGSWSNFDPTLSENILQVVPSYSRILVVVNGAVYKYDVNGTKLATYSNPVDPRHAILDVDGNIWIADYYAGLNQNNVPWGVYPNGPGSSNVFDMALAEDDLWVAPGGRTGGWNSSNIQDGIFNYIGNNWEVRDNTFYDNARDFIRIVVDPTDKDHVFAGSWGYGVAELYQGSLVKLYGEANTDSALQSVVPNDNFIRVGGLSFDQAGNLWVSCTAVENLLCVRKPNGTWYSYDFPAIGSVSRVADVLVDQQGYKWVLLHNEGILVYDDKGTLGNKNDDQDVHLVSAVGSGNVALDVRSIAEDLDGEIWIGTNQGVYVFYSPSLVFTNEDYDAQQILVEQDGYFQYLLETEAVTAIAIDGANRKWLGTENAGVFLMSEDGTTELQHFTTDNSPLISDNIITIAINHVNGEVFFGTEKGIISYKSTATEGALTHTDVYAYPNPVRESFTGTIAIKGLVTDADVKITDISGALIYQTKALGGQAIWDGKNFNGEKAHTGIYLVYATNEDGSQTVVTKIMMIN